MWEMKVPVLSTSHIKQNTLDLLEFSQVADYEEGAFVLVRPNPPEELIPVWAWFVKHYPGEHWLRFDRDGDVVDGLPTYEW